MRREVIGRKGRTYGSGVFGRRGLNRAQGPNLWMLLADAGRTLGFTRLVARKK
ncbi:hypothetical protein [Dictyobacter formicarum]|uniref:hypothetical protein n=1 Tax=Dictyobacter formicarum TaxID=2778368 RepID=UPI0019166350|nr:hypothetical protein [Dictyobacter formicarum]